MFLRIVLNGSFFPIWVFRRHYQGYRPHLKREVEGKGKKIVYFVLLRETRGALHPHSPLSPSDACVVAFPSGQWQNAWSLVRLRWEVESRGSPHVVFVSALQDAPAPVL